MTLHKICPKIQLLTSIINTTAHTKQVAVLIMCAKRLKVQACTHAPSGYTYLPPVQDSVKLRPIKKEQ